MSREAATTISPSVTWKPPFLQFYQLGLLALIVFLIHQHRTRLQIEADAPVTLKEVKPYYPAAQRLDRDADRMGLKVLDSHGAQVGYIIRTQPVCKSIIGYNGPTDTMIVFDEQFRIRGVKIRNSPDTFTHVADINNDPSFLKTWDEKTWDEVASMDLNKQGVT